LGSWSGLIRFLSAACRYISTDAFFTLPDFGAENGKTIYLKTLHMSLLQWAVYVTENKKEAFQECFPGSQFGHIMTEAISKKQEEPLAIDALALFYRVRILVESRVLNEHFVIAGGLRVIFEKFCDASNPDLKTLLYEITGHLLYHETYSEHQLNIVVQHFLSFNGIARLARLIQNSKKNRMYYLLLVQFCSAASPPSCWQPVCECLSREGLFAEPFLRSLLFDDKKTVIGLRLLRVFARAWKGISSDLKEKLPQLKAVISMLCEVMDRFHAVRHVVMEELISCAINFFIDSKSMQKIEELAEFETWLKLFLNTLIEDGRYPETVLKAAAGCLLLFDRRDLGSQPPTGTVPITPDTHRNIPSAAVKQKLLGLNDVSDELWDEWSNPSTTLLASTEIGVALRVQNFSKLTTEDVKCRVFNGLDSHLDLDSKLPTGGNKKSSIEKLKSSAWHFLVLDLQQNHGNLMNVILRDELNQKVQVLLAMGITESVAQHKKIQ